MNAAVPCGRCHLGLRWRSLWGHETCEGCAELGAVPLCGRCHLGIRWGSRWGKSDLRARIVAGAAPARRPR
eukprot:9120399-Pyramimonas_sp.AAC.1